MPVGYPYNIIHLFGFHFSLISDMNIWLQVNRDHYPLTSGALFSISMASWGRGVAGRIPRYYMVLGIMVELVVFLLQLFNSYAGRHWDTATQRK